MKKTALTLIIAAITNVMAFAQVKHDFTVNVDKDCNISIDAGGKDYIVLNLEGNSADDIIDSTSLLISTFNEVLYQFNISSIDGRKLTENCSFRYHESHGSVNSRNDLFYIVAKNTYAGFTSFCGPAYLDLSFLCHVKDGKLRIDSPVVTGAYLEQNGGIHETVPGAVFFGWPKKQMDIPALQIKDLIDNFITVLTNEKEKWVPNLKYSEDGVYFHYNLAGKPYRSFRSVDGTDYVMEYPGKSKDELLSAFYDAAVYQRCAKHSPLELCDLHGVNKQYGTFCITLPDSRLNVTLDFQDNMVKVLIPEYIKYGREIYCTNINNSIDSLFMQAEVLLGLRTVKNTTEDW